MGSGARGDGPARRLRVLLADRHPHARAALRADLEDGAFDVCAEAASGEEAVAAARREQPDLCLVDAGLGGLALLVGRITSESPAPRVVVTAVTRDEDDLVAAFRAGASGYLPKDVRAGRLRDALAAVAEGATMLPPTLAPRVLGTSDAR